MDNTTPKRPDDIYILPLKDEKREIFMSAALCQILIKTCEQNSENVSDIYTNAGLQELLVIEVLRPRSLRGDPEGDFTLSMAPISTSAMQPFKAWILEHILYFFIDSAQTAQQGIQGTAFQKLTDLLLGSQVSVPEKLSAGATDAEVVTQT